MAKPKKTKPMDPPPPAPPDRICISATGRILFGDPQQLAAFAISISHDWLHGVEGLELIQDQLFGSMPACFVKFSIEVMHAAGGRFYEGTKKRSWAWSWTTTYDRRFARLAANIPWSEDREDRTSIDDHLRANGGWRGLGPTDVVQLGKFAVEQKVAIVTLLTATFPDFDACLKSLSVSETQSLSLMQRQRPNVRAIPTDPIGADVEQYSGPSQSTLRR